MKYIDESNFKFSLTKLIKTIYLFSLDIQNVFEIELNK